MNTFKEDSCSVFGNINILDKDATRQYLYCLSPQQDLNSRSIVKTLNVGILDIIWRSNLGEKGHLQTSTLQTIVKIILLFSFKFY